MAREIFWPYINKLAMFLQVKNWIMYDYLVDFSSKSGGIFYAITAKDLK